MTSASSTPSLTGALERLWEREKPAFRQERTWQRGRTMMYSMLSCLGRHTVSGLICAHAGQFRDWSACYRLFEKERFDACALFDPIRTAVCEAYPADLPLIAALDDTLLPRSGRKIAGTAWRRDPLGPPFCNNFLWAQRYVQLSLILPSAGLGSSGRSIPVDFVHAPTPKRPKRSATEEEVEQYRQLQKEMRSSVVGAARIVKIRQALDANPETKPRKLVVAVDGGYTNREVFKSIPEGTVLIGRMRKDAQIFRQPQTEMKTRRGRTRYYGEPLPTPEALRQDETIAWQQVKGYAAGEQHTFEVKVVGPLRWKSAGGRDLQLMIVRPIAYRPRKGARLLYRDPAYLICSDPELPADQLLQAYLWRWEIEVNHREEKTLMGAGEAQVRTEAAVSSAPTFAIACYAMMHVAAAQAGIQTNGLPMPKWRRREPPRRCSSQQLIQRLRTEMWGRAIKLPFDNYGGFASNQNVTRTHFNSLSNAASAVFYASG